MSWSKDSTFTAADWDTIRAAIGAATHSVNDLQLLEASFINTMVAEDQANAINGALHGAIVRALRQLGGHKPTNGHHDLELFGLPIEIKTSGSGPIKTNRSYAKEVHGKRLMIAVNFRRSHFRDQAKVEPYLIRWGWIGPEHYPINAGKGQVIPMLPAGYGRLFALWSLPLTSFPAELIPGFGPGKLAKLGHPVSVGVARSIMAASGDPALMAQAKVISLPAVAQAAHWLTYGQKPPALTKLSSNP